MKTITKILTISLIAILLPAVVSAQTDGGGKKKKKPMQTEQTTSAKSGNKKTHMQILKQWGTPDDPFYTLWGIELGKTSLDDLRGNGYIITDTLEYSDGVYSHVAVPLDNIEEKEYPKVSFKNKVAKSYNITSYGEFPSSWDHFGLRKDMSVNELLQIFRNPGWVVKKDENSDTYATTVSIRAVYKDEYSYLIGLKFDLNQVDNEKRNHIFMISLTHYN